MKRDCKYSSATKIISMSPERNKTICYNYDSKCLPKNIEDLKSKITKINFIETSAYSFFL